MYASMGSVFKEVSVTSNKVHVECSEVERIILFVGNKSPKRVVAPKDGIIVSADLEFDARAKYIRVSIVDKYGRNCGYQRIFC